MTDLLLTILIMSLVSCGAHVVINDDILKVNAYPENEGKTYPIKGWMKPLWACCRCMSSVWGGATYYLLHGFDLNIIPAIIATAFLNSVFISYYYSKS